MTLDLYTTGRLRGILPPGVLHPHYPLLVDDREWIHHNPHCSMLQGREHQEADVALEQIRASTRCPCLTTTPSAPVEFRALSQHVSRHDILDTGRQSLGDQNLHRLHNAWSGTYLSLWDLRYPLRPSTYPEGSEALNAFLAREYAALEEVEKQLREQLQNHRRLHELHEMYELSDTSDNEALPGGTYLVASGILGLGYVYSKRDLLLACLQMDGLDLWSDTLLTQVDEATLSLYIFLAAEEGHEDHFQEGLTHVRLEESDTPEIVETAQALWDPSDTSLSYISRALEIARRV